jgi:hypothetical protein
VRGEAAWPFVGCPAVCGVFGVGIKGFREPVMTWPDAVLTVGVCWGIVAMTWAAAWWAVRTDVTLDASPPTRDERLSSEGRRVLEQALREALAVGHNWIGPEHIERALLRRRDPTASELKTPLKATKP